MLGDTPSFENFLKFRPFLDRPTNKMGFTIHNCCSAASKSLTTNIMSPIFLLPIQTVSYNRCIQKHVSYLILFFQFITGPSINLYIT